MTRPARRPAPRRRRHAGAALLAAMLTVTLVATFAAAAMWQQWRGIEIESADRERVQAAWILTGALDWARLILREDARSGRTDHLAEPWAVPLQEARLTTFLAADQNNNADLGDGTGDRMFLSGDITDLQGRLNVNNLVESGSIKEVPMESFRRLFDLLQLPQAQLNRMAENLRFASEISGENLNAPRASLPPQRVEQLAWLGLPAETIAALEPHITLLPPPTTVNLNTASAEVIYAAGRSFSLADAQRLVAERERQHFRVLAEVMSRLPQGSAFPDNTISLDTRFFDVRGRLRIDTIVIEEHSIVRRDGLDVRTLQRERGARESFVPPVGRR